MAQTRKSIIDEAFMEAESIERAFKVNSKEILAHTMGSEIEAMVKESLEGSNDLKEDEDDENVDLELDMDSDYEAGLDAGDDLELGDEDDMDMDFDLDDENMDMDSEEDLEVIDLTGEDDDTVVTVFKKMAPEDEIEVVQTGDGVEIKDNATGAEYRIDLGGSNMGSDEDDMDMDFEGMDMDSDEEEIDMDFEGMDMDSDDDDMDSDDDDMEDDMEDEMTEEVVYEIYMDDDMEDDEEEEIEEASRTNSSVTSNKVGNRKGSDRNVNRMTVRQQNESKTPQISMLTKENKVLKNKISSIESENETLKEDYNKMVDALKEFRQKLNEVAIFNSNLTYTVRLFTEHSTTKDEKVDIIKRFDDAKSLKESKNIYKNLVKEISKTTAPIRESIDKKLNETKSSGSSTEITESKVYVDPQLEKMKKLWEYQYKN
jgi:hypothetical protein